MPSFPGREEYGPTPQTDGPHVQVWAEEAPAPRNTLILREGDIRPHSRKTHPLIPREGGIGSHSTDRQALFSKGLFAGICFAHSLKKDTH